MYVSIANPDMDNSDPDTARQIEDYLRFVVGERHPTQSDRVREMIHILLPRGECRIDRVAQLLGVDRRTVHRHLAAENETFSGLVETVRRDLSSYYAASEGLSKTQIAQLLGFANLSSFSRWKRTNLKQRESQ